MIQRSVLQVMISALSFAAIAPSAVGPQRAIAQGTSNCWRFSFGAWSPPLDWAKAGHPGNAGATARSIQRIRDSVYVKDSAATNNNAMSWERTDHGLLLLLYPSWWPAGVEVTFDSTLAEGKEMRGTAVAMVADAAVNPPRAAAHAWQERCGEPQP